MIEVIDDSSKIKNIISKKISTSNFIAVSTGYYSYRTIEIFENEFRDLIENNGKFKLIIGEDTNQKNIDFFSKIMQMNKEDFLKAITLNYFDDFVNISNQALECAYELFAKDIIEIKIGISNKGGIFHVKNYIFESDSESSYILGSLNLSEQALLSNYEMVNHIVNSESFDANKEKFMQLWNNSLEVASVQDINEYVCKKIKEEAKARGLKIKTSCGIKLRDYQEDAVNSLIENDFNGFLEMATGTGKTFTTLVGLERYLHQKDENYFTLIVVPYKHLVAQWKEQVEKVFGENVEITECYSDTKWAPLFAHKVSKVKRNKINSFGIMVQDSLFNNIEMITNSLENANSIFIVDEAHNLTKKNINILRSKEDVFNSKLGLSATPENYLDEERTKTLFELFKGLHYIFELKEAIKKGYLTKYNYHPFIIQLDTDEENEYKDLTKKIKSEINEHKRLKLLDDRNNVLSKARNKINVLISVINKLETIHDTLIYCNPGKFLNANEVEIKYIDQISIDLEHETKLECKKSKITGETSVANRKKIVKEFEKRNIDIILAIKCLDEGYDIPSVRNAFILHSTRNPSEFVQRRGRVLRKYPEKDRANIYDFIVEVDGVVPDDEKVRFLEYYGLSDNRNEFLEFKNKYIGEFSYGSR